MEKSSEIFSEETYMEEIERQFNYSISIYVHAGDKHTVIPRFTRLPWQPKNRVNQNCPYRSHSIDKKLSKKCQKNFY